MKIRCLSLADYTKIASYVRDLSSQMGYQKRHRDRTKGKKVKTRNMSVSTVLNTSTKWIDPKYFTFPKPGQQSMFAKAIRTNIVRMLWRSVYFNISPLRHQGKKNQDSMNMGVGSGFLPADSPNFLFVKLRSNKKTLFSNRWKGKSGWNPALRSALVMWSPRLIMSSSLISSTTFNSYQLSLCLFIGSNRFKPYP